MEAKELARIIGDNMREARERSDISVNRLAEISGLDRQRLYNWEGMGSLTVVKTLLKLIDGFSLDLNETGLSSRIRSASDDFAFAKHIGDSIKSNRTRLKMTIGELCEKSGLSKPTIIAWEKGRRKDAFLPLEVVSQATKIPIHYFFMEDGIEHYYEKQTNK